MSTVRWCGRSSIWSGWATTLRSISFFSDSMFPIPLGSELLLPLLWRPPGSEVSQVLLELLFRYSLNGFPMVFIRGVCAMKDFILLFNGEGVGSHPHLYRYCPNKSPCCCWEGGRISPGLLIHGLHHLSVGLEGAHP